MLKKHTVFNTKYHITSRQGLNLHIPAMVDDGDLFEQESPAEKNKKQVCIVDLYAINKRNVTK